MPINCIYLVALSVILFCADTVKANEFPAPESCNDCKTAMELAKKVDGKISTAELVRYYSRAADLCQAQFSAESSEAMDAYYNLSRSYIKAGDHIKALRIVETNYFARRKVFGENNAETLKSMFTLAEANYYNGSFEESRLLLDKCSQLMSVTFGKDDLWTLRSIHYLAMSYQSLEKYDKALALNKECWSVRRRVLGDNNPDTLATLFNIINSYSGLMRHREALALLEKWSPLFHDVLGDEDITTMKSNDLFANTYINLGEYSKALELSEKSFAIRRARLGENNSSTLFSMLQVGMILNYMSKFDKALPLNEKCFEQHRLKFGDSDIQTFQSMSSLSDTYFHLGQFDKSAVLLERCLALKLAKYKASDITVLRTMIGLAVAYQSMSRFSEALAIHEKVLPLVRASLGEGDRTTLLVMSNLASNYYFLHEYEEALKIWQKVLELRINLLGELDRETIMNISNVGIAYMALNQYDKALPMNEKALILRRKVLGVTHQETLKSMHDVAMNYEGLKQYDKSLEFNKKCFSFRERTLGKDHPDTLFSMMNYATGLRRKKEYGMALNLFEQAYETRKAKLGVNHRDTIRSLYDIIHLLFVMNEPDRSHKLVSKYVSSAEYMRKLFGLGVNHSQNLFKVYADDFKNISLRYGKAGLFVEGFNIGDLAKARTLGDSIRGQGALRSLPASEQAKLLDLQSQATVLRESLASLRAQSKPDASALLLLEKESDFIDNMLDNFMVDLRKHYTKFRQITDMQPSTASDAKELLNNDEVFINYLIDNDGYGQVWLIDKTGEPMWVEIGDSTNLSNLVSVYREIISPSSEASASGKLYVLEGGTPIWVPLGGIVQKDAVLYKGDPLQSLTKIFSKYLIKDILPIAGKYRRWIISPDKDLALLPFDMLVADNGKKLGQEHNLTLVQSFGVYSLLKKREIEYARIKHPKELMAMGNAVYGDGWAERRGIQRGAGKRGFEINDRNVKLVGMSTSSIGTAHRPPVGQYALAAVAWRNLPGTEREVKAVAAAFAGGFKSKEMVAGKVDIFLGYDASESRLQELNVNGKLKDYRYLLFSAHGYLAQNPEQSSLVLSQKNNPHGVDGYVTATEWPQYDVNSELTVLSACDTGVGNTQGGEGVMGLPYALFVSGNRNTLLTLWPVDDDATAEFMKVFFSKLRSRTSQPEALSRTKVEFMQHKKWSDPRYWAAFVLYGA